MTELLERIEALAAALAAEAGAFATEQLEREVERSVRLTAGVEDVADHRVIDVGGRPGLAEEPDPEALVLGERGVDHLERDVLAGELMHRAVHRADRAGAEEPVEPVLPRDHAPDASVDFDCAALPHLGGSPGMLSLPAMHGHVRPQPPVIAPPARPNNATVGCITDTGGRHPSW